MAIPFDIPLGVDTKERADRPLSPANRVAGELEGEPETERHLPGIVALRVRHTEPCGVNRATTRIFLDAVLAMAEPVKAHFLWRPQLRDPGDGMVLETAVNGRADALVTFNVRDFGSVPGRFGIEVMILREALRRIRR